MRPRFVVVGLRHLPPDPPLGAFEDTLIDLRFRIRGPRPAPEGVLIVAIDDASLESIGLMTPMREALAAAIQRLEAAGAASIVIDLLLIEPTPADDHLAEVLVGQSFHDPGGCGGPRRRGGRSARTARRP